MINGTITPFVWKSLRSFSTHFLNMSFGHNISKFEQGGEYILNFL